MWFRRDLRLADNPALHEAVAAGPDGVVPLFVLDMNLVDPAGARRRAHLTSSLRDLSERVGGLHVVHGDPVDEVVAVARRAGAGTVHVSADHTPYGTVRDAKVEKALAEHGIALERTGSYYAISPGRVTKGDGTSFKVFTPFYRVWLEHGWHHPAPPGTSGAGGAMDLPRRTDPSDPGCHRRRRSPHSRRGGSPEPLARVPG